jgi:hypothetical protein
MGGARSDSRATLAAPAKRPTMRVGAVLCFPGLASEEVVDEAEAGAQTH